MSRYPIKPLPLDFVAPKQRWDHLGYYQNYTVLCQSSATGRQIHDISSQAPRIVKTIEGDQSGPIAYGGPTILFTRGDGQELWLDHGQGQIKLASGGRWTHLQLDGNGHLYGLRKSHPGCYEIIKAKGPNFKTFHGIHRCEERIIKLILDRDSDSIAWITCPPQQAPWQHSELWLKVDQENPPTRVAGGHNQGVFDASFGQERDLFYCQELDDTGSLFHRHRLGKITRIDLQGVSLGDPRGEKTAIIANYKGPCMALGKNQGEVRLYQISQTTLAKTGIIPIPLTSVESIKVHENRPMEMTLVGSSPHQPLCATSLDLTNMKSTIHHLISSKEDYGPLASPRHISWNNQGRAVFGILYEPPGNPSSPPPLLVMIHPGPTQDVELSWADKGQYFATRGYAVLYINYAGSTGHGSSYRNRLNGSLGLADVDDVISGIRYLHSIHKANQEQVVLWGGASGGATVLNTIRKAPDLIKAGIAVFPWLDFCKVRVEAQDNEAGMLDEVLGPWPAAEAIYRERSPIHHITRSDCALMLCLSEGEPPEVLQEQESFCLALEANSIKLTSRRYPSKKSLRNLQTFHEYYLAVESFLKGMLRPSP